MFHSSLQTHVCGLPGWARAGFYDFCWRCRVGGQALSAGLLQTVLVWGVAQLGRGGEAVIVAQAHSDADVQAFRVAFFDEAR